MIYYSVAGFNKGTAWMIDEIFSHPYNLRLYENNSFVQLDDKLRNKWEFHLLKNISRETLRMVMTLAKTQIMFCSGIKYINLSAILFG